MMETIILTLVIGFVLFELIEHAVFPLFWFIKDRFSSMANFGGQSAMFLYWLAIR